jgi:hypothetical protein
MDAEEKTDQPRMDTNKFHASFMVGISSQSSVSRTRTSSATLVTLRESVALPVFPLRPLREACICVHWRWICTPFPRPFAILFLRDISGWFWED